MKVYRILSEAVAQDMGDALDGWNTGHARTKELTGTVKRNEEILSHPLLEAAGTKLLRHRGLQLDTIPLRFFPLKASRYGEGGHYGLHTDSPWMGSVRTDLSVTLFLSPPDTYDGGELVVDGTKVKLPAGQCVVYRCGSPHEVLPVTRGERVCVVTWIQSRVRDAHKRDLVTRYRKFLAHFEDDQALFVEGGRIHSELLRMWME